MTVIGCTVVHYRSTSTVQYWCPCDTPYRSTGTVQYVTFELQSDANRSKKLILVQYSQEEVQYGTFTYLFSTSTSIVWHQHF